MLNAELETRGITKKQADEDRTRVMGDWIASCARNDGS